MSLSFTVKSGTESDDFGATFVEGATVGAVVTAVVVVDLGAGTG